MERIGSRPNVVSLDTAIYDKYDKSSQNFSFRRFWRKIPSFQKWTVFMTFFVIVPLLFLFIKYTSPDVLAIEKDTRHRPHKAIDEARRKQIPLKRGDILKRLIPKFQKAPLSKRGPPNLAPRNRVEKVQQALYLAKQVNKEGDSEKQMKESLETAIISIGAKQKVDLAKHPELVIQTEKQKAVVNAFKHAWKAYKTYAFGHDELKPISKTFSEWFVLGLTVIDSLDTMWLMNLKDEYKEARDWVDKELHVDRAGDVNLFECTIRILGGLLSIYHLTDDEMYLQKATQLGDRLLKGGFSSGSKVPYSDVNLMTETGHSPQWSPYSSLSEVTTIQLEFKDLSKSTGNNVYANAADAVMDHVFALGMKNHLAPIYISPATGQFSEGATVTLGARGDSYYEYLLKQWVQSGKKENKFKDEYSNAMESVMEHLIKKSSPSGLVFVGELLNGWNFSPKMDHLVCFLPGVLALGSHNGLGIKHMNLAKELLETCNRMYTDMPTGLSPEIVYFNMGNDGNKDIIVKPADSHNLLRPETVESMFVLHSLTGDKKYQDQGWKIFQAFEKYTKIEDGGYSSINNVMNPSSPDFRDKMESFFLGETLKYLFLLFGNQAQVSLDDYVFNTEAHPLPIWK